MAILDQFDNNILEINISCTHTIGKIDFKRFTALQKLYCSNNLITELNNLPDSLQILNCSNNVITELNLSLLPSLQILDCSFNQITKFNNLNGTSQNSLQTLYCYYNEMTELNNLPNTLQILYCSNNQISELNNLPDSLQELYCSYNQMIRIDLKYWKAIKQFRLLYYTTKYSSKIERWFIKLRNKHINNELLYSPDLPFFTQDWCENSLNNL